MKILAVGAHPDDAEISCGGLLALKGGVIVALTSGVNGTRSEKTAEAESEAAAMVLGVSTVNLGLKELKYPEQILVHDLDDIIEMKGIDTVITHPLHDTNQEHAIAAQIALAAARRLNRVLFWEPIPPSGRCDFRPQIYVDYTDRADLKFRAIEAYASQIRRKGRNLANTREKLDEWRGQEMGVTFAEAYEVVRWQLC